MSDIWFVCKQTDKVVELRDCLECKEPKNCLSLASYQQGRADAIEDCIRIVKQYDDTFVSLEDVKRITDGILEQLKEKK